MVSLFSFDSSSPGSISALTPITGIDPAFSLVGIDFRNPFMGNPNGQLYGLAYDETNNINSQGQLYLISLAGVATPVGSPITIGSAQGGTSQSFGFGFNPTVDRIRVVTGNGSNFRINPNDGAIVMPFDTPVEYAAGDINEGEVPFISAGDYQGGFLYNIDTALNVLVQQGTTTTGTTGPNGGMLITIGELGITALGANTMGFDIGAVSGTAFLQSAAGSGTQDNLYTVDLTTGEATLVGAIGPSTLNTFGISVFAVPEPGTYALLAIGLIDGALMLRRRKAAGV